MFGPQFRPLDTSDKRCHFVAIKQQNNITYVRRQEDILTASYILYIYQYSPSPGSNLNQGQTESETGAQNHSIAKFSTTKDVSKCVAAQCGSIKLSHFCQYDICFLSSGPHATFVYGGTVEQRLIELPSLLYWISVIAKYMQFDETHTSHTKTAGNTVTGRSVGVSRFRFQDDQNLTACEWAGRLKSVAVDPNEGIRVQGTTIETGLWSEPWRIIVWNSDSFDRSSKMMDIMLWATCGSCIAVLELLSFAVWRRALTRLCRILRWNGRSVVVCVVQWNVCPLAWLYMNIHPTSKYCKRISRKYLAEYVKWLVAKTQDCITDFSYI